MGTPTASGTFGFVIAVADQDGEKDQRPAELVVAELPSPKLLATAGPVGCGCSSSPDRGSALYGVLLALVGLSLRRPRGRA
jgi:MYXO-CTERM domain-containing protein